MPKKGNTDFYREWLDRLVPEDVMQSVGKLVIVFQMLDATVRLLIGKMIEDPQRDFDPRVSIAISGDLSYVQAVKQFGSLYQIRIDNETLEPKDGASPWQLLVRVLEPGEDFDRVVRGHGRLEASAHGRMERLLRQTGVPAGLLFNGRALRLLSAPRGESSGWLDFRVADMVQTAGRPISTALRLLLNEARLLSLPRAQRLAALLEDSRKFQNEVSERLAEQVLHALYELLRGFQAAHDASKGELLRQPLAEHPDEVYHALLIVILRLVFLLYAEERDMLPEDETFLRYYSLAGLYERLREDAALFPDTMEQRYGAWAQLLVLFRMVYDGAESGAMRLPKRHGVLFDPDR
ncbi:MAG: class I SAM-dependent DNA methyltransferase, partial [Chloroflexi bacterium]|nr:class I SAM-dependent DNA methyltransferase [Chloroflexota bacterium]